MIGDTTGQQGFSPFHYCMNNPVNFIDPFGLSSVEHGQLWQSSMRKAGFHEINSFGDLANAVGDIERETANVEHDYRRNGFWADYKTHDKYNRTATSLGSSNVSMVTNNVSYYVSCSSFRNEQVNRNQRYKLNGGVNWVGITDASLGIITGGLEIAAGVFGEVLTGGLSTIAIVDGVGRIGMNSIRLAAYSTGNSSVGKSLPSNLGGMIGKLYDGATSNKGFFEVSSSQNVIGVTNDAATFIIGGGSNMSTMLNPASNAQFYRAASSYGLYYYDNLKPIWQNK